MGVYIELVDPGINKIQVIEIIRKLTKKSLKEAKDMIDSAPVVVTSCLSLVEAQDIKKKFEEVGAVINLR
ncbi:MAG: ribosomal protein L7/L12 [Ignavibacteria bacterium]|nr:ribosomal protein L7/L12 [Ignavibacteria bacterium]